MTCIPRDVAIAILGWGVFQSQSGDSDNMRKSEFLWGYRETLQYLWKGKVISLTFYAFLFFRHFVFITFQPFVHTQLYILQGDLRDTVHVICGALYLTAWDKWCSVASYSGSGLLWSLVSVFFSALFNRQSSTKHLGAGVASHCCQFYASFFES